MYSSCLLAEWGRELHLLGVSSVCEGGVCNTGVLAWAWTGLRADLLSILSLVAASSAFNKYSCYFIIIQKKKGEKQKCYLIWGLPLDFTCLGFFPLQQHVRKLQIYYEYLPLNVFI